jgi:hypothetical protein
LVLAIMITPGAVQDRDVAKTLVKSFGWFFKSRRLRRDYKVRLEHSAATLRI